VLALTWQSGPALVLSLSLALASLLCLVAWPFDVVGSAPSPKSVVVWELGVGPASGPSVDHGMKGYEQSTYLKIHSLTSDALRCSCTHNNPSTQTISEINNRNTYQ
jgi:hypothetical protein